MPFVASYTDPKDGDLLPLNNDDNLGIALQKAKPLLRVIIQRKGKNFSDSVSLTVTFIAWWQGYVCISCI